MGYETVTVTQVRALDGTLHRDRAAAEAHDRYVAEQARRDDLIAAIDVEYLGADLNEWCGWQYEGEDWKRRSRIEEIADLIEKRWAQIKAAVEPGK